MSWRDELRRVTLPEGRNLIGASFRGVPFLVEVAERTGGRRTVTHEFPLRDEPAIEDLGRRARSFSVDGYVLGDDYLAQRDALLDALENESGPGEFVHPYYGTRRAICESLAVRESITDGGMARFAIEFTEVPAPFVVPVESVDLAAQVDTGATVALTATQAELEQDLDVAGQPGFAIASLGAEVEAVATELGASLSWVVATTQELARLDLGVKAITSTATSIVRSPADTVGALVGVLSALAETVASAPRAVFQALLAAYRVDPQPEAQGDTATRAKERANQAVFSRALRKVLAIEAARILPQVTHETLDDARADREAVAGVLEEQATKAGDESYPALVALRAAVLRAVPRDGVLARLVTIERRISVPSLVLAYQLYGSVNRELAVVARNRPEHPGFMSGSLQVLSNG